MGGGLLHDRHRLPLPLLPPRPNSGLAYCGSVFVAVMAPSPPTTALGVIDVIHGCKNDAAQEQQDQDHHPVLAPAIAVVGAKAFFGTRAQVLCPRNAPALEAHRRAAHI